MDCFVVHDGECSGGKVRPMVMVGDDGCSVCVRDANGVDGRMDMKPTI